MRPATSSVLATAVVLFGGPCLAQTAPVNGIRPAEVRTHAIVGATVVVSPGQTIEDATVVIRDGVIEAVGPDVPVPANARVHDGEGLTVYCNADVLAATPATRYAVVEFRQR